MAELQLDVKNVILEGIHEVVPLVEITTSENLLAKIEVLDMIYILIALQKKLDFPMNALFEDRDYTIMSIENLCQEITALMG